MRPLPPARLTRRGRIVVTGVSALLIGALSVGLATAAQATRAGSGSPGRYVAKVTVLPGQSLWSLGEAYDPNADTRLIVQEIQQLNSMSGDQVQAGEVLWVPRDVTPTDTPARAAGGVPAPLPGFLASMAVSACLGVPLWTRVDHNI